MLTDREREILALVCLNNKQIARHLNIAESTVKWYFSDMITKYKVKNRTMLLFKAIKEGELSIVDMGFFNPEGSYIEDWQVVDLKAEGNNG